MIASGRVASAFFPRLGGSIRSGTAENRSSLVSSWQVTGALDVRRLYLARTSSLRASLKPGRPIGPCIIGAVFEHWGETMRFGKGGGFLLGCGTSRDISPPSPPTSAANTASAVAQSSATAARSCGRDSTTG